jgi:2-polyprenyl-3-methyl-5-hydroxy-6-metoxy-1,4-benzoquinol methylase
MTSLAQPKESQELSLANGQLARPALGLFRPPKPALLSQNPRSSPQKQRELSRQPVGFVEPRSSELQARPAEVPCSHPTAQLRALFPAQDFITGHGFKIASCAACGLTLTTPQPGAIEIADYYPRGYYGDSTQRRFPRIVESIQQALYGHRVRQVESLRGGRPGRVLDVGCGRGVLLQEFRRRGWDVQGTELSDQAATYAREVLRLPVETGSLDTIGFPANHFDAITLWHVLEHVTDPQAVLMEANRILKPGGVLLVSVPNFGSCEARLFRDKWFHLDVPRHVTHLTKGRLQEALAATGFEDRRWSGFAPEYDSFSFVQSSLNRLGLRHNLLYNLLRGKQAKVIAGEPTPRWQVFASVLLGAALGIISLPVTFYAGLLGLAGTMTVLGVKRAEATARSKTLRELISPWLPRRSAQT